MDKKEIYNYRKQHKMCRWCLYNDMFYCKVKEKFIILEDYLYLGKECIFYEPRDL